MIIILKRADLRRRVCRCGGVRWSAVYQVGLKDDTVAKAELIVLIENSKVYVLKANNWPYGKPMSAAELIQYITNHVA